MSIAFSHASALEVLRSETASCGIAAMDADSLRVQAFDRAGWRQLKMARTTAAEVNACCDLRGSLSRPIHFMVAGRQQQRAGIGVVCHAYAQSLPMGSLVAVGSGDFAAAPELCLMQLACTERFADVVAIGFELAGTYGLDRGSPAGFVRRDPLMALDPCRRFLAKMGGRPGVAAASRVVERVIPGSASPMETIVAMLLSFPRRLGGYGLPQPQMNKRIAVADGRRARGSDCICDMFWPEQRVAVEYDSDQWHVGSERISRDAQRRVALANAGVKVITITNAQVREKRRMDEVARLLARLLGVRMRDSTGRWAQAKVELRAQLLAKR